MNFYSELLKKRLNAIIFKLSLARQLYVKEPEKDFTRKRKLSFETVVQNIIFMGGNSIGKELLDANDYDVETATSSAFVQQRDKILPEAFEFLFHEFMQTHKDLKLFMGYRLLAADGSDLHIPTDPEDKESYQENQYGGYNHLHLNALYDLCNRLYVDASVQPKRQENERKALNDMINRSRINGKVIVIGDRGYESYNCFAHIERKGWNYLIRVKDLGSNGILSGLNLPDCEFDLPVSRVLTRRQVKAQKQSTLYKFMPVNQIFDFLPPGSKEDYPISFRVVRFRLDNGEYQTVITNLSQNEFSSSQIKLLYGMRWGIETSFRALKYAIGLTHFHAKKRGFITQEIFARLIMYNFCEMITNHVVISQANRKYNVRINFTAAVHVCRRFLRSRSNEPPPDVEALIRRNILPVRPNRKYARKVHSKSAVSFIYRVT
jgi:hypothetical protein